MTVQDIALRSNALECSSDFLIGHNSPNLLTDDWALTKEDSFFFDDYESLSEEDKLKVKEHIKFLKHLAEQKNKE